MPIISLELLDEFLRHYSLEAPFIYPNKSSEKNRATYTLSPESLSYTIGPRNGSKSFGAKASEFIQQAKERFHNGELSPPLSLQSTQSIYTYFRGLNSDLVGNTHGTLLEQRRAKEWDDYWHKVVADFQKEGQYLTEDELNKVKKNILTAYRQKIISLCIFEPKGPHSDPVDEVRVQEYLHQLNQLYDTHTAYKAYEVTRNKLVHDFEKHLWLDVQSLSRLLNTAHHRDYVNKLEETLSRKTVEFLGPPAQIQIFAEIMKDNEFMKQLPTMLKNEDSLKDLLRHFPDVTKRVTSMTQNGRQLPGG